MPRANIEGLKFGRLTVLHDIGSDKHSSRLWKCLCECGKFTTVRTADLTSEHIKSCGCLRSELSSNRARKNLTAGSLSKLPKGEGNLNSLFGDYKRKAKERNFEFSLTREQFKELTQQKCFYCGIKPHNSLDHAGSNGKYIYNGIDRTDNTKGYIIDNCITCCGDCNWMKKTYTQQEFLLRIKLIYDHMLKERNG